VSGLWGPQVSEWLSARGEAGKRPRGWVWLLGQIEVLRPIKLLFFFFLSFLSIFFFSKFSLNSNLNMNLCNLFSNHIAK
jgi:hypothetical protein